MEMVHFVIAGTNQTYQELSQFSLQIHFDNYNLQTCLLALLGMISVRYDIKVEATF